MKRLLTAFFAGLILQPSPLWACAACYGQSDSAMARGMNWGIFSLMVVVIFVLSTIATFFVYLGKRSAATTVPASAEPLPGPEERKGE